MAGEMMKQAFVMIALGLASAAGAAESPVTPGKWQATTVVQAMKMPGMPPEAAKRMIGKEMSATICITPKDAAAGPKDLIGKSNGACRYRKFDAAAGKISAVMECKTDAPTPQVIAIDGTYSKSAYDIRSILTGGGVQSTSRTVGKRLGNC
jgi:hypothetical protein